MRGWWGGLVGVMGCASPAPPGGDAAAMVRGGTLLAVGPAEVVALDPEGAAARWFEVSDGVVERDAVALPGRPRRAVVGSGGALWITSDAGLLRVVDGAVERVAVCPDPRGVAADGDGAWVVCGGGELVGVDGALAVRSRAWLAPDLRDVVWVDGALWVSRFKAAEVLVVEGGRVARTLRPPAVAGAAASLAWRLVAGDGGALLVHQRASTAPIVLADGLGSPPYGGPGCDSVVQSAVTWFPADGAAPRTSGGIDRLALPVDAAVAEDGAVWIVAGGAGGLNDVALSELAPDRWSEGCQLLPGFPWSALQSETARPAAVARVDGAWVVQTAAPFGIAALADAGGWEVRLDPPGDDARGVDLLHRAPIGTVACASCHPEGGEDGLTWRFVSEGVERPRRTQALYGATTTAPLHWDGEHADLAALVVDSFEARIGGALAPGDVAQIEAVLARLAPPPGRAASASALVAGAEAFRRSGCAACHGGPWLTDGLAHDIGRQDADGAAVWLQTPPLRGVGSRGPWMHDGCAETLEQRFDPACGGSAHGQVDPADIPALVALLASF
jgi:hypothetical protein